MDERARLVLAADAGEDTVAGLCRRFGVSRKTGHKWLSRYGSEGLSGLQDRSRAPLTCPQAIGAEAAEACLAVRRAHPTWGPAKVLADLERRFPARRWPAASTIGALFDREGLTVKRRRRRRWPGAGGPFAACEAANQVWGIDFKGGFLTGDGRACEPLTLQDAHSRYLLRCLVLGRNDTVHVWPVLDAAFREFGLPEAMRSDNGPPFASSGAGGLSSLSVRLIKAGVRPQRIKPGRPQQNGRLERLHLTLLQDAASPPADTFQAQLRRLAEFRRVYNGERPHQALKGRTPEEAYTPAPRPFDGVLREPEYPPAWDVRRVRCNGEIKWQGQFVYLNCALAGEPVGLAEETDGGWRVRYGPVELGHIPYGADKLHKPPPSACGLVDDATPRPQGPQAQTPPR